MLCGCCGVFFFSSRRRHTRCALVTGVQTCALPIFTPTDPAVLRSGLQLPPEAGWPVRAIRRLLVMAPGTARGYAILGARGVGFRQGFARALAVEPEDRKSVV